MPSATANTNGSATNVSSFSERTRPGLVEHPSEARASIGLQDRATDLDAIAAIQHVAFVSRVPFK